MEKNKKKWNGLLLFLLPVLVLFLGVNYLADPGNIFHNFSEEMSGAMLEGKTVQVHSNNLDDREVLQHLIEKMPDKVGTIVCGPSLALCIDSEMAGTDSFFNMAVSASDYYDLLACIAMLEVNGKQVDRVILTWDSVLVDPEKYMGDGRHDRLMPYSEYMLKILEEVDLEAEDVTVASADAVALAKSLPVPEIKGDGSMWSKMSQLFSVSYFQWSVEYVKTQGIDALWADRWSVAEETSGNRYLPDYSMVYGDAMETITLEEMLEACKIYWMEGNVTEYAHADKENLETLEKLIVYLQSKGTEVELFLCPLAPALWDRIYAEQYPMLSEMEEFAAYLAEKYNVEVQGSYNPYNASMTNEDFYDARHARKSALQEKFNFAD